MSQEEGAQWQPDGLCQEEGCQVHYLTEGPRGSFVTICQRHHDLRVAQYCARKICGWCWKVRGVWQKINLCAQCKLVHYCSKECQLADWHYHHSRVCSPRCNDCNDSRVCYKVHLKGYGVSIKYCPVHFFMSPYSSDGQT